jgi:uncharacterized coiled-coil DUF342 family protein
MSRAQRSRELKRLERQIKRLEKDFVDLYLAKAPDREIRKTVVEILQEQDVSKYA